MKLFLFFLFATLLFVASAKSIMEADDLEFDSLEEERRFGRLIAKAAKMATKIPWGDIKSWFDEKLG